MGDEQNFISEMETLRNKTEYIFPVSQPGDGRDQASGILLYISLTPHSPLLSPCSLGLDFPVLGRLRMFIATSFGNPL